MLVPILLAAMVAVLFAHGYVLRKRTRHDDHGVFFDVSGSHTQALVGSMQEFAPTPRGHGFDTRHWASIYWG